MIKQQGRGMEPRPCLPLWIVVFDPDQCPGLVRSLLRPGKRSGIMISLYLTPPTDSPLTHQFPYPNICNAIDSRQNTDGY